MLSEIFRAAIAILEIRGQVEVNDPAISMGRVSQGRCELGTSRIDG